MTAPTASRRWWPAARRLLYLAHRWLGIAGCVLFAMWFASGLVMMYVGFPSLTPAERLAGLPPLRLTGAVIDPAAAWAALPPDARSAPPASMGLEMVLDEPVWRIVDASGRHHALSARSGQPLGPTDAARAEAIARAFAKRPAARWAETLARDQWTVPDSLDALRPFHRIAIGDAEGTELYVSSRTGEVARDTTRRERLWNWIGAVPHWLYFTPLRADPPLWRNVVKWVSGTCIASAVTGLVLGVLRVRLRRRYRSGAVTPYRGWMAWHHVVGLVFGVFVLTWITSGWLSMNPRGWFDQRGADAAALARYQAANPALPMAWPPAVPADARALTLGWFSGRPLLQWHGDTGQLTVMSSDHGIPLPITQPAVEAAVRLAWPGVPLRAVTLLQREDAHWVGHHDLRVLPVWRVVLGDENRTWLHVDPRNGRILDSSTRTGRLERWLFNAPHTLDFPWLIQHRPAWDLVMWPLCLAGLLVSISAVVIGSRRLRASFAG